MVRIKEMTQLHYFFMYSTFDNIKKCCLPLFLSVANSQQRNRNGTQKFKLVISIFIVNWDLQNWIYVFNIAERRRNKLFEEIWCMMCCYYNVKSLFHVGFNVLYSVWVCNREFTNWRTQNGSLFPPKSAEAKPVALNTLTVKWPTSRTFLNVLKSFYFTGKKLVMIHLKINHTFNFLHNDSW